MTENGNSDNQTQMVKPQDFMGQCNSFVSGASDQLKNMPKQKLGHICETLLEQINNK